MKGIRFCATGAALPHNSVSNEALSQRVDTSDDWIRSRTGIAARCIAGEGENLTQLASMAGAKALAAAGWDPASLDLILLATSSPDDLFGSAPASRPNLAPPMPLPLISPPPAAVFYLP